jgi:uncharacterized OB-fold protein/acyl dehydratase
MSERFEELAPFPDHTLDLESLIGLSTGAVNLSPDAVNMPMIRHWIEAMGDENPVYVSDEAARAYGYDEAIAPPTMLQAWIMRGLRASQLVESAREEGAEQGDSPTDILMGLCDSEGLTSVVATNCEQQYTRPLVVGDRLMVRSSIEDISEPKRTALGTGRFLTTRLEYRAVPNAEVPENPAGAEVAALFDGAEVVATMKFRILKYLPPARSAVSGVAGAGAASAGATASGDEAEAKRRPPRPRPSLTQDNAFWFQGARDHELLIQRCTSCGTLRHPPLPACGTCRSFEWDTVTASGRGVLYSFVVVHYPQVPSFEYPLPIGLVELEEGTRVVANLEGVEPGELRIGMELEARFVDFDDDLSLPVFAPVDVGVEKDRGVA